MPAGVARRIALLVVLALVALVGAACSSAPAPTRVPGAGWVDGAPAPRPGAPMPSAPNIVFVLTDDLTWNLVRFMPHVRAMQRDGVTFRKYFVSDSLCCPSRASIFTGLFPHNSGVLANLGPDGGFDAFIAHHDQDKTYASVIRSRRYETGLFGKFLNLYNPAESVLGQRPYISPGWSAWVVPNLRGYTEYNYTLAVGRHLGIYGDRPRDYLTSVLGTKADQFMTASVRAHRPFFAQISTFETHAPFVPAPQDVARFPGIQTPRGPSFGRAVKNAPHWLERIPPLTPRVTSHMNALYRLRAQQALSVDRLVGEIQQRLDELGVADNTYLVFSSDNGLHLGEHDLRQGKGTAFDTDIHVPLIVTGPGIARSASSQFAQNVDLAPTFEALSGAAPRASLDGRSLVPQLHGRTSSPWRNTALVEHEGPSLGPPDPDAPVHWGGNAPSYEAIRSSRYLYVEYVDGERELYDLTSDPYEQDNVFGTAPRRLRDRLHAAVVRLAGCQGANSCWAAQLRAP